MSATASVNQANAQHSTGPNTEEGKQRSSLNALRHGLTGRHVTLPSEDIGAYKRHGKSFEDHLQPQGPVEATLVQSLADTAWRLNRIVALETKLLKSPDPLETQIKALSNLSLYTQRLTRQFEKIEKELRELQTLRRVANQQKPNDSQTMASFFQAAPKAVLGELAGPHVVSAAPVINGLMEPPPSGADMLGTFSAPC